MYSSSVTGMRGTGVPRTSEKDPGDVRVGDCRIAGQRVDLVVVALLRKHHGLRLGEIFTRRGCSLAVTGRNAKTLLVGLVADLKLQGFEKRRLPNDRVGEA